MNVGKSNVMKSTRSGEKAEMDVIMNSEQLAAVSSFKYLCSHVDRARKVEGEVRHRVKETRTCMDRMKSVMSNRPLGLPSKTRLYEGVVVPTSLYVAKA